jgi:hypothetical protein
MDTVRVYITPICALVGVLAVLYIFSRTMAEMPPGTSLDAMKEATAMAGSAIAMIGTLIGFVAGQAVGAAGKEKAEERATAMTDKAMNAAQAVAMLSGMAPDAARDARNSHPKLFE